MARRARRAPTLATVAAAAGVSRQTVSNALNNPGLLRAETLARVQAAVERLGYSPNRAARNLRTASSHLIGLRIDAASEGTANALMDRFVHSLVASSEAAGYHVLLFSGPAEEPLDGYQQLLRSAAVDAFVVTDTFRANPQSAWLAARGVPFVAFGRPWGELGGPLGDSGASHPWVDVDGRAGTALAVDHLVGLGHVKIAWVGWQRGSYLGEDRRSGWCERMRDHGLATQRLSVRGDDTVDFGARAARALLDHEAPTAFVCASDTLAMGVLRTASAAGLHVGRDLAVTGFDDSIAAQVGTPGLTSVRQPLERVAVEVVGFLGELLAHRQITEPGRVLTPTLRVRESSGVRPPS